MFQHIHNEATFEMTFEQKTYLYLLTQVNPIP